MTVSQEPTASVCEYLEFDSKIFGFPLARLTVNKLTEEIAQSVEQRTREQRLAGLYFLADAGDAETARLAALYGYNFIDIRMTLEARLATDAGPFSGARPQGIAFRLSRPEDIAALKNIARTVHQDSRFYFDSHFPRSGCDALYEQWIEKSCTGWAQAVWIAEADSRPVAYVSCHLAGPSRGQIGLVGVDAKYQGRQIGSALVRQALGWFQEQRVSDVSVVTQGRNVAAQRLYQRCGFLTSSVQAWYHLWMDEALDG